jgi:hypothetical protein
MVWRFSSFVPTHVSHVRVCIRIPYSIAGCIDRKKGKDMKA